MAISKLESVPVDTAGLVVWFVAQRPAVRRERVNGQWTETPKARNGVVGVEVDVLVKFPAAEEKSAAKFTVYGPVPRFADFEPLKFTGPVIANVWTGSNGGGGLWFEVPGITSASGASAQAKSSEKVA